MLKILVLLLVLVLGMVGVVVVVVVVLVVVAVLELLTDDVTNDKDVVGILGSGCARSDLVEKMVDWLRFIVGCCCCWGPDSPWGEKSETWRVLDWVSVDVIKY